MFRSGFVNIIGKPNVGKSTLMNALVGEKLAIITPKAQTTRKRILGIVQSDESQIIFSDTPGFIHQPQYKLHEWMNEQIQIALQDADILILMTMPGDDPDEDDPLLKKLTEIKIPLFIVINKIDTISKETVETIKNKWIEVFPGKEVFTISALKKKNIDILQKKIIEHIPEHPAYFEKDELTDQTERFFAAEMIREKIFLHYQQEIPYSVETAVEEYKDKGDIIVIKATIFVGRDAHKNIIIGKGGSAIKQVGVDARKDIEEFTGKKVFLELFVKVKENWKNDDRMLKYFGYH